MSKMIRGMGVLAAVLAAASTVRSAGLRDDWTKALAVPEGYSFTRRIDYVKTWRFPEFDVEFYRQANGPGTSQRVFLALPKNLAGRRPAVLVPFYFPEAMLGFDPETGARLPRYEKIAMMADLAKRGFVTISADAYHLTYLPNLELERTDFSRWRMAGEALAHDWPEWSGVGKLVADTRLLVDILVADSRVDSARIGIIGHSLGGKMAFYTGCLDSRIKVIVASDFGIGWDQTNWRDPWYWGEKLKDLRAKGMDHAGLLSLSGGKPFCLIAGGFDDASSGTMMRRAKGYERNPERLVLVNHATGHRPPPDVLATGYLFLERYLAAAGGQ